MTITTFVLTALITVGISFLLYRHRKECLPTRNSVKFHILEAAKREHIFLGFDNDDNVLSEAASNMRYQLIIGESGSGKTSSLKGRLRNELEIARVQGKTIRVLLSPFRNDPSLERFAFDLCVEFGLPFYVVSEGSGPASAFELVAEMSKAYDSLRGFSSALAIAVQGIPDPKVEFFFDSAQSQIEKILRVRPQARTAREIMAALNDGSLYDNPKHEEFCLGLKTRWRRLCEPDSWNTRYEDLAEPEQQGALTMDKFCSTGGIAYIRCAPEFPAIASFIERALFASVVNLLDSKNDSGTTLFIRDEHPVLAALGPAMDISTDLINRGRAAGVRLINICQGLAMYHQGQNGGSYVSTLLQSAAITFYGSNDGAYTSGLLGKEWNHEWWNYTGNYEDGYNTSYQSQPFLRQEDLFHISLNNHQSPRALMRIPRAQFVTPYLYLETPHPQPLAEVNRQELEGALTELPGAIMQKPQNFFENESESTKINVLDAFKKNKKQRGDSGDK